MKKILNSGTVLSAVQKMIETHLVLFQKSGNNAAVCDSFHLADVVKKSALFCNVRRFTWVAYFLYHLCNFFAAKIDKLAPKEANQRLSEKFFSLKVAIVAEDFKELLPDIV